MASAGTSCGLRADLREFDNCETRSVRPIRSRHIRVIEANAAALYFPACRDVQIRFRERDLARIPARWIRAIRALRVFTGAPRAATSPINALRNYLFACLESKLASHYSHMAAIPDGLPACRSA